jgi:hypothetical protein
VDLHALTHQREQSGEGLVEGHGRWIVAGAATIRPEAEPKIAAGGHPPVVNG